ncbi:hypothetical protein FBF35_00690 [Schaalia odontolytica]|nr:hypothetical protein FBF35_00690 [Schaalia odontolytica]
MRSWAAARPRDRHTRASLGVVDLEARPGPAAAHERRSHTPIAPQALRWSPIGRACVCPGPAAHRHRGQALRSLRRPPHQWCLACC